MKFLLVILGVIHICTGFPVLQQPLIDNLLMNALLQDVEFDIEDFNLQEFETRDNILDDLNPSSVLHVPMVTSIPTSNSPIQFLKPNLSISEGESDEKSKATITTETTVTTRSKIPEPKLGNHQENSTTTIPKPKPGHHQENSSIRTTAIPTYTISKLKMPVDQPMRSTVTTAYPTESPAAINETNLLDLLSGSKILATTTSVTEKHMVASYPVTTQTSVMDTDKSNITYSSTAAPPYIHVTSSNEVSTQTEGNIRDLWNKALGVVNDFTTEMSIIGLANLFTKGTAANEHSPVLEATVAQTAPSKVKQDTNSSSGYIDDALSAVDDLSTFLADILTLKFR